MQKYLARLYWRVRRSVPMTMDLARNRAHAQELLRDRITRVELRTDDLIPLIVRDFLDLIDNPPKEPRAWAFNMISKPGQPPDWDTGFWESVGQPDPTNPEREKDHKKTFHFRAPLFDKLTQFNPEFLREHRRLLFSCQSLLRRFQDHARGIVRELDDLLGTQMTPLVGREGRDNFDVIRILGYTGRRKDTTGEIGGRHNDRSAFTYAAYESGPGLQGAQPRHALEALHDDRGEHLDHVLTTPHPPGLNPCKPYEWVPISSEPNRPLLFNACKPFLLTGGRLKPLYHGVVQVPQPKQLHPDALRIAIVAFLHLDEIELPEGFDTHRYIE